LASLPRLGAPASRVLALAFSLSTLVLALAALGSFDCASTGYQFVERHGWIGALNSDYHLGLDGLSLLLVLLTGLLAPACMLASWRNIPDPRFFGLLFLLLQGAALGAFLALDFFHWFIFWELSLIPAYFLIKLWGGPRAAHAAYQLGVFLPLDFFHWFFFWGLSLTPAYFLIKLWGGPRFFNAAAPSEIYTIGGS